MKKDLNGVYGDKSMNKEFVKWLEEQKYDFNYLNTSKPMSEWEEIWFIKSVHDSMYPPEIQDHYVFSWSKVITKDFTIDE